MDSSESNEITFIEALGDLILGTKGGEWRAGAGAQAISADNPPNIRPQSNYGAAANVRPVIAGRGVLMVTKSRMAIRDLSYALETDGYQGPDITLWAKHLFRKRAIVDMCFQKDPDLLLWVLLSDGTLRSCVYMPEEKVMGWSRHETDGRIESCETLIRNDGTEELYVSVIRTINGQRRRFIEMLAEPFEDMYDPARPGSVADAFFVDSGLSHDGPPADVFPGLAHLEGAEVVCYGDGNVFKGLTVTNGTVTLPRKVAKAAVGLPYRWELETVELDLPDPTQTVQVRKRQLTRAWIRFYQCRECRYGPDARSRLSEFPFRTGNPGVPIQPFTGDKEVAFSASASGQPSSSLYLCGDDPVPAGVLAVMAEVSIGD